MLIVFFRALILYAVVFFVIRIMGKKELSKVQPFELAIIILISDLASAPMSSRGISIFDGIVPIITLLNGLGCGIVETDFDTFKNNLINYSDEYTKEYLLGQNLNSYSQDFTLRDLADLDLAWHKTDAAYLQKVIDVIKSL